jgi:hypothetical protein
MRKLAFLPLAALVLTAACNDAPLLAPDDALLQGSGNPHFLTQVRHTGCSMSGNNVSCWFKAAGLASGTWLTVDADVEGTVQLWCENNGGVVPGGWAGRLRVGAGSDTVGPASRNGSLSGNIGPFPIQYTGGAPFGCPPGLTLHHLISNLTWTISGDNTNNTVNGTL